MSSFVHLHNHTHYSLLDAVCTVKGLVKSAADNNMSAVALTDHGVTFGLMEFYKEAKKSGVKPLLGCEVYVASGSRFDKVSTSAKNKTRNYYHLVLLAKNLEGYHNLCRLTSIGHTEGFYYKPRIDRETIEKYKEGLICLSACAGGVVSQHFVREDWDAAKEAAMWYREQFREDFYLEIQNHFLDVDKPILSGVPDLAKELGVPLVVTNDVHYIKQEHAIAHNCLLHIRDASKTGAIENIETDLRYGTKEYYFKTAEQMNALFADYSEALGNTLEIANKCDVTLPTDLFMPKFPIPQQSKAQTLDDYLVELTWKGMEKRFPEGITDEARQRCEFELDVITRMGYSGYFLIVQDFIQAARDMGVSVGPGRGSAAGSLVAFALWITNVDPLKYDLLFERFLNPDRVSMPDIDIDFSDDKREKVIEYVRQKYGQDAVAQIITFGTLSSRAVLKDVGRVLGIPLSVINSITEKIAVKFGRVQPLGEALEGPELRWVKESDDPQIKKLIEYALVLEGLCRNSSLHAAGVVIAPGPLQDYIPLYKSGESGLASQYTMNYLEDAGLLKMDFLGLRTLSIIDNTLELIRQRHGITIDIDAIPLDDPKTYELVGKGSTTAVFQFESPPMQEYLKQLKPGSLEDLTAMNALYRPGPMENIPDFIDRKHGRKPITYLHPMLEPILGKTYGVCVSGDTIIYDAISGKRMRLDEAGKMLDGLYVQGVDHELRSTVARVTNFYNNGKRSVVQVRLRNGSSVKMTPDHKVLTEIGWQEIGKLGVGDYIATPRQLSVTMEQEFDRRKLRILAYLLADGSLASGTSCDFVSKDPRLIAEYEKALKAFDKLESWSLTQVRDVKRIMVKGIHKDTYHKPNSLTTWMRELGLKDMRGGCRSHEKFVPDFVFALDRDAIAYFLASLWDCDGHVGDRICHYKTISRQLSEDIQTLLLRLGIHSTIYTSHYKTTRRADADTTAYQVSVYDLRRFAELIGPYLVSKHVTSLNRIETHDSVSRRLFVDELRNVWEGSARALMNTYGFDRQHLNRRKREVERISVPVVADLAEELELKQTHQNTHVRWEQIISIEPAGEETVYDITVEGIHNFVGNNIILHNCAYQEQVMQIAQQVGGFTLAQADNLRRAMGKKQIKYMEEMQEGYLEGCKKNGIEKKKANEIWDMMVKFANYGFNKSHSLAYSYLAYQTAWLKANYTSEFLAANMTAEANDLAKVVRLIDEARKFDIRVLPPDVNESWTYFTVTDEGIRFGLAAIRNVGEGAVESILKQRTKDGPFTSLFDFTKRLAGNSQINKRLLESLVISGAFDSLHSNRRQCFQAIESALGYSSAAAASAASGMESLFADPNSTGSLPEPTLPRVEDWNNTERLSREKEALNFYVSGHPLEDYAMEAEAFSQIRFGEIGEDATFNGPIRACGIIAAIRTRLDKRENRIAFVTIEDFTGKAECIFWSDAFKKFEGMLREGATIFVTGKAETNGADGVRIVVDEVIPVANARERFATAIAVTVQLDNVAEDAAERTRELFQRNQGGLQCIFRVYTPDRTLAGRYIVKRFTIAPNDEVLSGLKQIYGTRNVTFISGR